MSVRTSRLVDVHIVSVAVCRKELDAEFEKQSVQPRVVRRDPLPAELVGLAADLRVPEPSAHTVPGLEDDHAPALVDDTRRGSKTSDSGADDGYIGLDQAGFHASFPSAAAAAARPVRTAPSIYPATH